jgi:hypothetical protein
VASNPASLDLAQRSGAEAEAIASTTAAKARTLWFSIARDPDRKIRLRDRASVFGRLAPAILRDGQTVAVRAADHYLARFLSLEVAEEIAPLGLDPAPFLGLAGTDAPASEAFTKAALASTRYSKRLGFDFEDALKNGGRAIGRLTRTEVMQAWRAAVGWIIDGREIRGRPRMRGYTRMVTSSRPCAACMSRAGATFVDASVFPYHPGCGCVAVPIVEGRPDRARPPSGRELFERMTTEQQDRILGPGAAKAVREGKPLASFVAETSGYMTQATLKEAMQ